MTDANILRGDRRAAIAPTLAEEEWRDPEPAEAPDDEDEEDEEDDDE